MDKKHLGQCAAFLFIFILFAAAPGHAFRPRTISFCDSISNWPPFAFHDNITGTAKGVVVDLLHEILDKTEITFEVHFMPWKRCLEDVKYGSMDVAMNASLNDERTQDFLYSVPIYTTTPAVIYSKTNVLKSLNIRLAKELKPYKACTVSGYNIERYGLTPENIIEAHTFDAAVEMLKLGRCDIVAEDYEIIAGYRHLGRDYLSDPDLIIAPITDIKGSSYHFLLKKGEQGENLKILLDARITKLREEGKLDALLEKYIPRLKQ